MNIKTFFTKAITVLAILISFSTAISAVYKMLKTVSLEPEAVVNEVQPSSLPSPSPSAASEVIMNSSNANDEGVMQNTSDQKVGVDRFENEDEEDEEANDD